MKISTCIVAASLALLGTGPALAAHSSAPKIGQRVDFCGMAGPLMNRGCTGVRAISNGHRTIYNISQANPQPKIGEMVEGRGRITANTGACPTGIPLNNVTWKKVAVCPAK